MKEWKLVSHTFAFDSALLSLVLHHPNISLCRLDMPCALDDRVADEVLDTPQCP